MKRLIYICVLMTACLLSACDDLLDRPALTRIEDEGFWRDETDLRLYANGFYETYFVGYNRSYDTPYAPMRSTTFCDDFVTEGSQSFFDNKVPTSRGSSSETRGCLTQYWGPDWGFARIRKVNTFMERIESITKANISDEAYRHWMSVAKFFKAYEYYDLVNVFGDVPYFEHVILDTQPDIMYKDRDDRGYVMDQVYDMLDYALDNMRASDGHQYLNKYIAAGFASRFMLNEGTWQKYHKKDDARARKYLELAVKAGNMVINSGKWSFSKDYKSLFVSADLKDHPEVLLYRHYDSSLEITHHIGSYTGGYESQTGTHLALAKAFVCSDGLPYKISTVGGAKDFSLQNLAKTRDPRYDATFVDRPHERATSLIYCYKFAAREALDYYFETGGDQLFEWKSSNNVNDFPVMRLGEIVLNWIEAKQELAESYGGAALTQEDLDMSVNGLRSRPLDEAAVKKGVKQTQPLKLNVIPDDPDRDQDVSPLLWEIRRERRMELFNEGNRIKDVRRWKKLDYMDYDLDTDKYLGPWVDFPNDYPEYLISRENAVRVKKEDGTIVLYDGTNASEMVGYFVVRNAANREAFTDRSYLAPVGQQQIDDYAQRGYVLTQTTGW